MLDGSALAAVSERSALLGLFPRGGWIGDAADTSTTASPCRVDKAWKVGSGAYEGSDTKVGWLQMVDVVGVL